MDTGYGSLMTTTEAAKTITSRYIGVCAWAGHRFTTESTHRAFCPANCPTCAPVVSEVGGQEWVQRSAIKWAGVKAVETARKCNEQCTSAKNAICACECAGENHGAAHGSI